MKKFLCLIIATFLIICISGCGKKTCSISPVLRGISFNTDVSYLNESFKFFVTSNNNGKMKMDLLSPEELKGLTFEFNEDNVNVTYNGLEYKNSLSAMPQGIVTNYIFSVFKDAQKEDNCIEKENNTYFTEGKSKGLSYKMFFGETGLPISIMDVKSGFDILIKNVKIIKD